MLNTDEHLYFGSISALYDHFTPAQLGVALQTLYNKWKNEPYLTDMVVLRKGRLIQKEQHKNIKLNQNLEKQKVIECSLCRYCF